MTVGEKIQFYRKKIGLSQEELGSKMLVSRQTVSLWEMDKTLPTVDNLLRLKDIFSVSVDDILSEVEPSEESATGPKEAYVFRYNKTELREVFKKSRKPFIARAAVFAVSCAVLFVIAAGSGANNVIIGLIFGYFLAGLVSHIKGYFAYRKSQKNIESKILESTYSYDIFDGYFVLNISRNGEITKTLKFYFDEIEKIYDFGKYFVISAAGQSYIIKKEDLIPDSAFLALSMNAPKKTEVKKPNNILRTVSILLFVLSLCTIFGALLGVSALSSLNPTMEENMWVFFLFTPIPVASIVFGFYLKKKGCKYKKNVIVGFIMAAILCLYGSFSFIFAGEYSHSDEPILKAEQLLEIDIPSHSHINTHSWEGEISREYIYYYSDIYFDADVAGEFEKNLSSGEKWISDVPSDIIGIKSYFLSIVPGNYYIIYNKDTKEFNKLPSESGTYEFISIMYDTESDTMRLIEYNIEYVK